MKRLYRSKYDRFICGICGGLAEYFDVDPSLVRIAVIIFTAVYGSGLLAYIIAAFVIPENPYQ